MRLLVTRHAALRMLKRRISIDEVRAVLEAAQVVEEYPNAQPSPCRLVLGHVGGRPLHVVIAADDASGTIVVVTVYQPDEGRWDREFRRRR